MKSAVTDLYSARTNRRRAETDRVKAIEKRRKDLEAAASGAGGAKRRKVRSGEIGVLNFENEGRREVPTYTFQELQQAFKDFDKVQSLFSEPFIVREVPWIVQLDANEQSPWVKESDKFKDVFNSAKLSNGAKRGQLEFDNGSLRETITKEVTDMFLAGSLVLRSPDFANVLTKNMQTVLWGYDSKSDLFGFERALLPTVRVAMTGTRLLAISRFSTAGDFVRQSTGQTNKPLNSQATVKWIQEASAAEVQDCLAQGLAERVGLQEWSCEQRFVIESIRPLGYGQVNGGYLQTEM